MSEASGLPSGYRGKRLLDLILLAIIALPASVLVLVCAVAILIEDGRPLLLRQTRVGRDGRPFVMFKLRTMARDMEPESEVPDPVRVTRVGRLLRRGSVDELPQLVNVARGEMSVIGPRPTFAHRADCYQGPERERLRVLPGLTGLAQVSGRNRLSWQRRTELDLRYVTEQRLRLDLIILVRSIWMVLVGDGVHGHPRPEAALRNDG
jgi:lipopolysaccharide/colanic/teichoic acid biosynthesis glycosyltransferase